MNLRIACQTLPWSEYSFEEALAGIKAAGYAYMAFGTTHRGEQVVPVDADDAAVSAIRRQVTDAGLKPVMMFGAFIDPAAEGGVDAWKRCLDQARLLGIGHVLGIGPWGYKAWPDEPYSPEEWQAITDPWFAAMVPIAAHAEQIGVRIVLKPHTGVTATAAVCKRTVQRIGSPAVRICYDGGNVHFYEGVDPAADIKLCAELVDALCIKDHIGPRANPVFPCPGDGDVDDEAMLAALKPFGFCGPVAVERFEGTHSKPEMSLDLIGDLAQRARLHLEGVAAKLG